LQGFHEGFGTGFGDGTQVVDEIGFGHTDTCNTFFGERENKEEMKREDILLEFNCLMLPCLILKLTGITDFQNFSIFVGDDANEQVFSRVQLRRIGQGHIANFVQGIGGVGNQFTKEDLFVRVERIDDQAHQLRDFGCNKSKGKGEK
jgi:hypothetical protein